jgi:hypothetical protein
MFGAQVGCARFLFACTAPFLPAARTSTLHPRLHARTLALPGLCGRREGLTLPRGEETD